VPSAYAVAVSPTDLAVGRSTTLELAVLYWAYLGAALGHDKLTGRDLDQVVAQLMWFARQ